MKSIEEIVQAIDRRPQRFFQMLIGIDGLGASGKTTIAEEIKKLHPESSIIHLEDFYLPKAERTMGVIEGQSVSPDFDWDRFEQQVIKPAQRSMLIKYERYDWKQDAWADWVEVPATHWIIIVGVYALQYRFFSAYDYTIWIEMPKEIRLKRMIEREGEVVAKEWESKWLPREENYLATEGPDKRAASTILENTSG